MAYGARPPARSQGGYERSEGAGSKRQLVRFGDIKNPETVERVDRNDLAKSFGPGVSSKRATIEITDDPVTTGIEQRLPWWNGPFPWLKPLGNGVYVDTRTEAIKVTKDQFQHGMGN